MSRNLSPRMMNGGWVSDGHNHSAFLGGILWRPARMCGCKCGHPLFSLDHIPKGQWMEPMNDLQVLIEQMAVDIFGQAMRLDDLRLRLFLGWLGSHSSKVKFARESAEPDGKRVLLDIAMDREANIEEHLKLNLKTWFASLPLQGMLWEYHIILGEITWWRDLDPRRLIMILRSEEMK